VVDTPEQTNETFGFRPLYQQVRDSLIERLKNGEWQPGEALGSEIQLAEDLGVSQGTVRKAINELADRHLVVRRQGRGTFVAEHNFETDLYHYFKLVNERGVPSEPDSRMIDITTGPAEADEADKLGMAEGDDVIRLRRIRSLDDVPTINEKISVPSNLFPGLAAHSEVPNVLYEYFQTEYRVTVVRVVETLTPILAEPIDAEHIGASVGSPLLRIDRIAYTFDDRPVEWRISRCLADRFKYQVELM